MTTTYDNGIFNEFLLLSFRGFGLWVRVLLQTRMVFFFTDHHIFFTKKGRTSSGTNGTQNDSSQSIANNCQGGFFSVLFEISGKSILFIGWETKRRASFFQHWSNSVENS